MPAIINSSNQIELQGSDSGWSRAKIAMPAAPSGTTNAIYVLRYWVDSHTSDTIKIDTPAFDPSQHCGFSFTSSHPANLTSSGAGTSPGDFRYEYKDFWPTGGYPISGLTNNSIEARDTVTAKKDYALVGRATASNGYLGTLSGNGDFEFLDVLTIVDNKPDSDMPFTVPVNPTVGQTATFIWQVYSHESNETVYSRYWVNTDSVNLGTFDIETDLDPSDPFAAFPISNSWSRDTASPGSELNTDPTTGGNWRPSSGVMGFPTYFMARYGMDDQKFVVDYVGVHYSEATVS
jgi:hypothetical protein